MVVKFTQHGDELQNAGGDVKSESRNALSGTLEIPTIDQEVHPVEKCIGMLTQFLA